MSAAQPNNESINWMTNMIERDKLLIAGYLRESEALLIPDVICALIIDFFVIRIRATAPSICLIRIAMSFPRMACRSKAPRNAVGIDCTLR